MLAVIPPVTMHSRSWLPRPCGRSKRISACNGMGQGMALFLFRCPTTGQNIQGWLAEDVSEGESYRTIDCLACRLVHVVNPVTGNVLGQSEEE